MIEQIKIAGKTILVTGANRGIGNALVEEALRRGAKRVFACTRTPFTHPDARVTPLILDVTNDALIEKAVEQVGSLDILINNAGVAQYDNLSDRAMIERHMAVNFFGIFNLSQAFIPALIRSSGAIVNILSLASLASIPPIASYSISKAAAFSLTQSQRAFLAPKGVSVHAVITGPVDTDMNRGFDIPKIPTELAAKGIFNGIENNEEDIFPDPLSASIADSWRGGAVKAMERQNATFVSN